MTLRKTQRRARALARFSISEAPLYFARKNGWRDEAAESLGAILGAAMPENVAGYRAYVVRKHVELDGLRESASA